MDRAARTRARRRAQKLQPGSQGLAASSLGLRVRRRERIVERSLLADADDRRRRLAQARRSAETASLSSHEVPRGARRSNVARRPSVRSLRAQDRLQADEIGVAQHRFEQRLSGGDRGPELLEEREDASPRPATACVLSELDVVIHAYARSAKVVFDTPDPIGDPRGRSRSTVSSRRVSSRSPPFGMGRRSIRRSRARRAI